MNTTQTTLTQLRDAIAVKQVSAVEATRAYLDRIEKIDPTLSAYREVYTDRALARAAEVDAGGITGPLAGVPIAIKDLLCTDYGATTCSSKILENFHSPYMATAVRKLEDAGAVIIGKTNMDEFAMGSSCENSAFGPTRNPWDTNCVPGGSSGGSAAAMAADMCAGAIGTDTGGSIRQPAAYCGVVGLKPTYGRISRWGLVAFASSLDQIGPITRTVADAALLLQVMAGHDALDSTSADVPVPDYTAELGRLDPKTLRIGLAKQYMSADNHPQVNQAVERALAALQSQGATVVDVAMPHTKYGIPTYYIVATAEASSNLARYDGVHYGHRTAHADDLVDLYARSRAEGFGDEVKRRIMLGTYVLSSGYYDAYYLRALKVRRLIKNDFDAAFDKCDVLLTPTAATPAFKLGEKVDDPLAMYLNDIYTVNVNLAGIAAISLPAGLTSVSENGDRPLPLGVQLIGSAFGEQKLLQIANLLEESMMLAAIRPSLS